MYTHKVGGAQKLYDVWLLYMKDNLSKESILLNGFTMYNKQITVYEVNPHTHRDNNTKSEKITIHNLLFHIDNTSILNYLTTLPNVNVLSKVLFDKGWNNMSQTQ